MKTKITKIQILKDSKLRLIDTDLINSKDKIDIEQARKDLKLKYECDEVLFNLEEYE